ARPIGPAPITAARGRALSVMGIPVARAPGALYGEPGMPTPEGTEFRSRLAAWGFFVLLVALSTPLMASAVRRGVLLTDESPLLYHAATLAFNYFDFGSVRRG